MFLSFRSWSGRESLITSVPSSGSCWATPRTCRWRTNTPSCWKCRPPARSSSAETSPVLTPSTSSSKARTAWGRKSCSTSWRWVLFNLRRSGVVCRSVLTTPEQTWLVKTQNRHLVFVVSSSRQLYTPCCSGAADKHEAADHFRPYELHASVIYLFLCSLCCCPHAGKNICEALV